MAQAESNKTCRHSAYDLYSTIPHCIQIHASTVIRNRLTVDTDVQFEWISFTVFFFFFVLAIYCDTEPNRLKWSNFNFIVKGKGIKLPPLDEDGGWWTFADTSGSGSKRINSNRFSNRFCPSSKEEKLQNPQLIIRFRFDPVIRQR